MIRRLSAILRKEFIQIVRDPRTLILSFAIPVVLLLLFGFAVSFDVDHLKLVIGNPSNSSIGRQVTAHLDSTSTFDIVAVSEDAGKLARMLDSGEADLMVAMPSRLLSKLGSGQATSVQALVNGSDSTIASRSQAYLTGAVAQAVTQPSAKLFPAGTMVLQSHGFQLVPRVLYNPELESRKFFVPGLMVIIMMLVAVLVTSMTVVRERERGTFEQLIVSPVHPLELMTGKMIPYGVITFLDVLMVMLIGNLVFGVEIKGSVPLLLAVAILFLAGCLGLGLFISATSRTQENAFMVSMVSTMLPTFILSGFVFPIESMPNWVQVFSYLFPARYFLIVIRGIILKGVGLETFWEQVLMLVVFAVVALLLAALKFKKRLE